LKRKRYQKGSLQLRKHGGRRVWVVLFYTKDGKRGYQTLGLASDMAKREAQQKAAEFMRNEVNGHEQRAGSSREPTLGEFLDEVYLPFCRGKWKESTALTTEQRLKQYIVRDLGNQPLAAIGMAQLQAWLQSKGDAGLSKSIVDHLRFDLRAIFRLALANGVIVGDPSPALYSPRVSRRRDASVMSRDQVLEALAALPQREILILHLAVLVGMRPGEILALQRRHVSADGAAIQVEQRVYGGVIGDPKTYTSRRGAAIAPETAVLLVSWLRDAVEAGPNAYLFPSEAGTPLRPGNLMRRIIRPSLRKVGLEWVNFQTMRRTHASLGHDIDPKVMADQRGHTIGVALDVYTRTTIEQKAEAAGKLARKILETPGNRARYSDCSPKS
jgi:integrase